MFISLQERDELFQLALAVVSSRSLNHVQLLFEFVRTVDAKRYRGQHACQRCLKRLAGQSRSLSILLKSDLQPLDPESEKNLVWAIDQARHSKQVDVVVQQLLRLVDHRSPAVAFAVARALRRYIDRRDVRQVVSIWCWTSRNPDVRAALLPACWNAGMREAVRSALKIRKSDRKFLRVPANVIDALLSEEQTVLRFGRGSSAEEWAREFRRLNHIPEDFRRRSAGVQSTHGQGQRAPQGTGLDSDRA